MDITIHVQPTPNPNALKFVLNQPVKASGNSSYRSPIECIENTFATSLFTVRGVDQIHLFDNVITITKFGYEDWDEMIPAIEERVKQDLPNHDPNYFDPDPEEDRRRALPPELKKIEEILDRTIRPGLQGDGGDIQTISIEDNVLLVQYQGACGTCPSSSTGTLEAIKGILRDEYDPNIDVYIAPSY
jgi:Fe-S cluster biogenesis protein NfuA